MESKSVRNQVDVIPSSAEPIVFFKLCFADFAALIQACRGADLGDFEKALLQTSFRKLRPIEPALARQAVETMRRQLGLGLHIRVYLDALQTILVRERTKKGTRS